MADSVEHSWSRKLKDITAGFVGGAAQVLVGQPFDLVKVRLQTAGGSSITEKSLPVGLKPGRRHLATEIIRDTLKNEGLRGFYRGTVAPLFGVGACVSVQFYSFHEARRQLLSFTGQKSLTNSQYYIAGATAGVANSIIAGPVEQLRILLQTQKGTGHERFYKGPTDAIKKISSGYGWHSLFRGQSITILREFQAYGVWFATYEYLIKLTAFYTTPTNKRVDIKPWYLMLCGALAGEALWLSSYPLDVIKTRIQSDGFGSASKYKSSTINATKAIYREAGLIGFWHGIIPTLLRAFPASAATFGSVELAMRLLG